MTFMEFGSLCFFYDQKSCFIYFWFNNKPTLDTLKCRMLSSAEYVATVCGIVFIFVSVVYGAQVAWLSFTSNVASALCLETMQNCIEHLQYTCSCPTTIHSQSNRRQRSSNKPETMNHILCSDAIAHRFTFLPLTMPEWIALPQSFVGRQS